MIILPFVIPFFISAEQFFKVNFALVPAGKTVALYLIVSYFF